MLHVIMNNYLLLRMGSVVKVVGGVGVAKFWHLEGRGGGASSSDSSHFSRLAQLWMKILLPRKYAPLFEFHRRHQYGHDLPRFAPRHPSAVVV